MVELFPAIFPWAPPRRSGQGLRVWPLDLMLVWVAEPEGVIRCPGCHLVVRHKVDWPDDAYYRWAIRGETLWAWCDDHARAILEFVEGSNRNARTSPTWGRALDHIPAHFLSRKVRQEVVQNLRSSVAETAS